MPAMSARDFLAQLNDEAEKTEAQPLAKPRKESTMFPIIDNLPIPQREYTSKYPFANLSAGQAFVIPVDVAPKKGIACVRGAIAAYRKKSKTKAKFVARMLDGGDIGVWRTE